MRPPALLALVCVAFAATSCLARAEVNPSGDRNARATFTTDRAKVNTGFLWVADADEERRRGLMGVQDLEANGGMVFVFDGEQDGSFWMKDTLIPLSIAFWGDEGRLVDILEMEPCTADPCPTYSSQAPYTHALEMNAHWFEDRGIEIGDRVELSTGTA
jgi:uncharacterized membrane protein (UPF0127 family)